jgi:hypothetical protein
MKKIAVLLVCLLCTLNLLAQNEQVRSPGSYDLQGSFQYGFIIAHRPAVIHLQQRHIRGFEIRYFKQTEGTKPWQQLYNFPLIGCTFNYFNFGNDKEVGDGFTLLPTVKFPLMHKNHLRLTINVGIGIGYATKKWDIDYNYKNLAIGSNVNAVISTGLRARIFTAKRTQIETGIDLTHFSNGAAKIPNMGINMASINLGLVKYFGEQKTLIRDTIKFKKSEPEISVYLSFGKKSIDPPDSKPHGVMVVNIDAHKKITCKSKVGLGAVYFLDTSGKSMLEKDSIYEKGISANSRVGIHGSYGLTVGEWSGYFQTGVYIYNLIKIDGSIYSKLSLRYAINEHLFACFNLKSHYAKADYFEYGIGYTL